MGTELSEFMATHNYTIIMGSHKFNINISLTLTIIHQ